MSNTLRVLDREEVETVSGGFVCGGACVLGGIAAGVGLFSGGIAVGGAFANL